jgi:hypothetical protein
MLDFRNHLQFQKGFRGSCLGHEIDTTDKDTIKSLKASSNQRNFSYMRGKYKF